MDDNEEEPSGALYQLTDTGCVRRDPGYVVTNGPAESPDGHVLYHTDTLAGIIYAFDRTRTGTLANKRVFARFGRGRRDIPTARSSTRKAASGPAFSEAGGCSAIHPKANC